MIKVYAVNIIFRIFYAHHHPLLPPWYSDISNTDSDSKLSLIIFKQFYFSIDFYSIEMYILYCLYVAYILKFWSVVMYVIYYC